MNPRTRFAATMHYAPRDRSPIYDFGFWDETIIRWYDQGLPRSVLKGNTDEFFGMDEFDKYWNAYWGNVGVNVFLEPRFAETVIEDRGDYEVVQQDDGARVLRSKLRDTIPQHQGHLLTDRASWNTHYRPRLDPTHPDRYPSDWDERVKVWTDANRDRPLQLPGGSLYGWLRNWMGLENVSLLVHRDPALFEEMVTTVADCIIGVLTRVFETGGRFDSVGMWEDMCFNTGPLLGPNHFKRFLVPHYRRIADLCRGHGVDVIWVDCDGKIDDLLPLWLEAGVNCMFPVEVGTWGADPIRLRREYGKELLMLGGFDKRLLADSPRAIEREVHRLTPLVEEGGFIGFCDHRVPPDVPLVNHLFYLRTVRAAWGRGVHLEPMAEGALALLG